MVFINKPTRAPVVRMVEAKVLPYCLLEGWEEGVTPAPVNQIRHMTHDIMTNKVKKH